MNRIRIIGGTWRSRLVTVPEAIGLRPTPDRVRETLFNWLGQDLDGLRCLDLFAGTGALGFEAASRGASEVVMVEANNKVIAHLRQAQSTLNASQVRLQSADATSFLASTRQSFDVIFCDPPYRQGWVEKLAPQLVAHLSAGGHLYVESEYPITQLDPLVLLKSGRAGQVHYHLFSTPTPESDDD